MLTVDG